MAVKPQQIQKLVPHGRDFALLIDDDLLAQCGIDQSTPLELTVKHGQLIISPAVTEDSAQDPAFVASVTKVMDERSDLRKRLSE